MVRAAGKDEREPEGWYSWHSTVQYSTTVGDKRAGKAPAHPQSFPWTCAGFATGTGNYRYFPKYSPGKRFAVQIRATEKLLRIRPRRNKLHMYMPLSEIANQAKLVGVQRGLPWLPDNFPEDAVCTGCWLACWLVGCW